MSGLSNCIVWVCVSIVLFHLAECQVTVTNVNGTGTFLCGNYTRLECAILGYGGGMSWKLDGTIIAQCAFGSCTALGALPSGDMFTPNETAKTFNLDIGITHADNGTQYQCDDGSVQDQITVNIQVPPSESAFPMNITETTTSITVEAGCFYPSDAGRMDVYCVSDDGTEVAVKDNVTMEPTTTGCTGDCAGPNIYTAVGSISINSSNMGGNSRYRFKVYHEDFKQYAISTDSTAIYNCGTCITITTLPTTITQSTLNFSYTDITAMEPTTITNNITTEPTTTSQTSKTGHPTSLPPTTSTSLGSACVTAYTIVIASSSLLVVSRTTFLQFVGL